MAFAQHDFDKSDAGITVVQSGGDPISGAGALRIDNAGNEVAPAINLVVERLNASFVRGLTQGRVRTLMNISDHLLEITREGEYGIYSMASQLNLTAGGAAYAFVLHVANTFDWRLVEYASGVSIGGGRVEHEAGSTFGSPALGKTFAIEFEWRLDLDNFGGIKLVCRAAEGTNFGAMQEVYNTTLGAAPLLTSVAEGLLYADLEGSNAFDFKRCWFQNTFYANYSSQGI